MATAQIYEVSFRVIDTVVVVWNTSCISIDIILGSANDWRWAVWSNGGCRGSTESYERLVSRTDRTVPIAARQYRTHAFAIPGFGTDEKGLINVLCRRTADQRAQIAISFKSSFGKVRRTLFLLWCDIYKANTAPFFNSSFWITSLLCLGPDFWHKIRNWWELRKPSRGVSQAKIWLHCCKPPWRCCWSWDQSKFLETLVISCTFLRKCEIHGIILISVAVLKESVLIDALCTSSNEEIRLIQDAYHRLYKETLEEALASDTSGHFRRLLVSLCMTERSEDVDVDEALAAEDADSLAKAGVDSWGTDESIFNLILVNRSYPHLREVFYQ